VLKRFAETVSQGGHPVYRQVLDALKLRLRRPPVGISEYFDHGIWHRSITPELRDQFIGWRQSALLDQTLNLNPSRVLANDKLITCLILQAKGLAIPEPVATYSLQGRAIAHEQKLPTLDAVRRFLAEDFYPFYVKPISGGYGRHVLGVETREGENLRLMDGSLLAVDDFLKPFEFKPYQGMLFQRPLKAHADIASVTGTDAVSCVRFICLIAPSGPVIHTAFWKITVGKNMLDNFSHGHFGNNLGAIDLASGKITRAISKVGPGGEVSQHAGTGRALVGFTLPEWQRAVDLVLQASAHFPGLRLQNWDVAMCREGPVLIELNTESEMDLPQAISGRGLMDDHMQQLLAEIAEGDAAVKASIASRPES